ncbi:UNVERIFIED_CONTAM: hypothetical protein K2H54_036828 [Gekko kuhli]
MNGANQCFRGLLVCKPVMMSEVDQEEYNKKGSEDRNNLAVVIPAPKPFGIRRRWEAAESHKKPANAGQEDGQFASRMKIQRSLATPTAKHRRVGRHLRTHAKDSSLPSTDCEPADTRVCKDPFIQHQETENDTENDTEEEGDEVLVLPPGTWDAEVKEEPEDKWENRVSSEEMGPFIRVKEEELDEAQMEVPTISLRIKEEPDS